MEWFSALRGVLKTFVAFLRSRPDIYVVSRYDAAVTPGESPGTEFEQYTVHVTVSNESGADVTINDVGIVGAVDGKQTGTHISIGNLRQSASPIGGPSFPHRLKGHDNADWTVPGDVAFRLLRQYERYYSYCERFSKRTRKGKTVRRTYDRKLVAVPDPWGSESTQ